MNDATLTETTEALVLTMTDALRWQRSVKAAWSEDGYADAETNAFYADWWLTTKAAIGRMRRTQSIAVSM